jgi:hypothetical protein
LRKACASRRDQPATRADAGSFAPGRADAYCLVWENKGVKPVQLEYSYTVGDAAGAVKSRQKAETHRP